MDIMSIVYIIGFVALAFLLLILLVDLMAEEAEPKVWKKPKEHIEVHLDVND